jgi:hypothetical protein
MSSHAALGTILEDEAFPMSEKAALLGGTARNVLGLPSAGV